jgi:putative chitinase
MFPKASEHYPRFLDPGAACDEFDINTPERLAAFFAQLSHESSGLTRLEESFAYTPARLRTLWPTLFDNRASLAPYFNSDGSPQPAAIANRVYAMRMGNGPEKSGDGFRYRGRGFIQLTGKNNYSEFGTALGIPLVADPDQAANPSVAARIAGRFWKTRDCNARADLPNIAGVTRAINGGLTGLKERTATWQAFRALLGLPNAQELTA